MNYRKLILIILALLIIVVDAVAAFYGADVPTEQIIALLVVILTALLGDIGYDWKNLPSDIAKVQQALIAAGIDESAIRSILMQFGQEAIAPTMPEPTPEKKELAS
jgi:hypothetical protein